jgi:hypothetical protein
MVRSASPGRTATVRLAVACIGPDGRQGRPLVANLDLELLRLARFQLEIEVGSAALVDRNEDGQEVRPGRVGWVRRDNPEKEDQEAPQRSERGIAVSGRLGTRRHHAFLRSVCDRMERHGPAAIVTDSVAV